MDALRGQETITWTQRPESRNLPVREDLNAVCFAEQSVTDVLGMSKCRGADLPQDAEFRVLPRSDRDSGYRTPLDPARIGAPGVSVPSLECCQVLVLFVWIPEKADKGGYAAGTEKAA